LDNYLGLIQGEGERLLALAGQDVDRSVPQYPGWTISNLLAHTGSVLGRSSMVCRDRLQERPTSPKIGVGQNPLEWFETRLEDFVMVMESATLDVPVWGFGPSPNVGFWLRRMLVEVGIHRWDTEQAFGRPLPLLDEVAIAGLDEFPQMWLGRLGEVSTVEVSATDLKMSWLYGPGEPLTTVEASGSDLYLRLMSRPSPARFPDDWSEAVDVLEPPPG
jgi:uncharacterized protein (TIGR03083 family)